VRITGIGCLLVAASSLAAPAGGAAEPEHLLADFSRSRVIIETSRQACLVLDVYLAETPEQHAQGLMFIRKMDAFEGMLFRYKTPRAINMWMKNTYIPLDMLFFHDDGSIAGITAGTTPLSTRRISSPGPVSGVLEVHAGFARTWQVQTGDRLHME
jgi:uncharacterized membrane protein (UPF0127 family)